MAGVMTDKQAVRRTKLVAEDLGSHLAPHEQRAASASDDRKLRSTMLAANSGRLLATLEAERGKLGLDDGYHAPVGPSGEKPVVPDAYLQVPRPDPSSAAPPLEDLLDAMPMADEVVVEPAPPVLTVAPDPVDVPVAEPLPATDAPPALAPESGTPAVPAADLSIPQIIRELAGLHADGILTDEEFADKKRELLARL